jgi:hypothetical protein
LSHTTILKEGKQTTLECLVVILEQESCEFKFGGMIQKHGWRELVSKSHCIKGNCDPIED